MAAAEAIARSRWLKRPRPPWHPAPFGPGRRVARQPGPVGAGAGDGFGHSRLVRRLNRSAPAKTRFWPRSRPRPAWSPPFPTSPIWPCAPICFRSIIFLKDCKPWAGNRTGRRLRPDFVFIDYADSATFDAGAGYYHPAMKTVDGRVISSSDQLLHDFLKRAAWKTDSRNELTLMQKRAAAPAQPSTPPIPRRAKHVR